MSKLCTQLGIPERLHKNGRDIDAAFLEDELIYRRFKVEGSQEDWNANNQISVKIFPVSNDSCNRSKYCESPEDVLFNTRPSDEGKHYLDWGIIALEVTRLNDFEFSFYQNSNRKIFLIKVEHVPSECMYPHSEIRVYENDSLVVQDKPKSTKSAIRKFLMDRIVIVKEPQF